MRCNADGSCLSVQGIGTMKYITEKETQKQVCYERERVTILPTGSEAGGERI